MCIRDRIKAICNIGQKKIGVEQAPKLIVNKLKNLKFNNINNVFKMPKKDEIYQ